MRSVRLAITIFLVASLSAATAIAPAQARGGGAITSNQDTTEATKSNRTPGTTTGSASTPKPRTHKGVLPNPSIQNPQDSGIGRGK
jgi:hypothetical protein